jgi:hypothetical protein
MRSRDFINIKKVLEKMKPLRHAFEQFVDTITTEKRSSGSYEQSLSVFKEVCREEDPLRLLIVSSIGSLCIY